MRTLIPEPRHVDIGEGEYRLAGPLRISGGGDQAAYLAERLSIAAGIRATAIDATTTDNSHATVVFTDAVGLAAEEYRITVSPSGVRIEAGDEAGRMWAVQTLLQLFPPHVYGPGPMQPEDLVLPCVTIDDAPRYRWRGSHIDVARHFLPFEGLMQHLELMAMHKLNVLHLHLTDDQGWRVPITAYPRLTEAAAWRPGSLAGHQPAPDDNDCDDVADHDGHRHGGFYTRGEIAELNARARTLGIVVVPEIDMPGHMESVVAAYPELGCIHVEHPRTCWGISEHVLSLSSDAVDFCRTVLKEVADLFPGAPIHVGGDECPGKEWMEHEASLATMRAVGAKSPAEAQAWFEKEICSHVLDMGRRVIAWDEVLEHGAPSGTTVMVWRDSEAVNTAASAGHDVIAAPTEFTYLDYRQHRGDEHPLTIGGYLPLSKVAGFSGLLDRVTVDHQHRLLGGQFQLWSEYVHDWSRAQYMLWPRGSSIAQQLWAGAPGNAATLERMREHTVRLTAAGINWCRDAE